MTPLFGSHGRKLVTACRVPPSATCGALGSATPPAANSRNLLRESFILLLHKLEDRFVVSPRVSAAAYPHFLLRGWPAMPAAGPNATSANVRCGVDPRG